MLRTTKIVLTEPAPIRGGNSRWRSRLARNCARCVFDFFNRIGQLQPLDIAAQIVKSGRREPRETSHHPPLGWIAQSASCHRKAPVTGCALDGSWKAK